MAIKTKKEKTASQKYAFDVSWVFVGLVSLFFMRFALKGVLTRSIGPDGLGYWAMVSMLSGMGFLLAELGIRSAVVKFVAQYNSTDKKTMYKIFSAAFINVIFLGCIATLFFVVTAPFFADFFGMELLNQLIIIIAVSAPFNLVFSISVGVLQGIRRMRDQSVSQIVRFGSYMVLTIILLQLDWGVEGVVTASVLSYAIGCVLTTYQVRDFFKNFDFQGFKATSVRVYKFGIPLVIGTSMNQVMAIADTLMIGFFMTEFEVGYYSISIFFVHLLYYIPQSITTTAFPAISAFWAKRDHRVIRKLVDKQLKYTTCILLFLSMGMVFFGKEIIVLYAGGDQWSVAYLPLVILLIGNMLVGVEGTVGGGAFAGTGHVQLGMRLASFYALMNVVLNFLFIPNRGWIIPSGMMGAALATTTARVVQASFSTYYWNKILKPRFNFRWFVDVAFFTLAVIIAYVVFNYFVDDLLYRLLFGVILTNAVFISIVFVFLEKEDIRFFLSLFGRKAG